MKLFLNAGPFLDALLSFAMESQQLILKSHVFVLCSTLANYPRLYVRVAPQFPYSFVNVLMIALVLALL